MWEIAPDLTPMMCAVVLGGWRKGEIVNLRHADVDLKKRWAYVLDFEGDDLDEEWTTKTLSSLRAVPLHPVVAEVLGAVRPVKRPDGQASPWVFPVTDRRKRERYRDKKGRLQRQLGDRRSPSTGFFGKKLRLALKTAGVNRTVRFHGLRRTFA